MLTEELCEKLRETLAVCDLHNQRMLFAWESIRKHFPLTELEMGRLSDIDMAFFDQLIYRFSKLQDSIGSRFFKQLLEALEEDISALPFIDILNKLEKLNLIEDAKEWITLRQIRNTVSHEYPFFKDIRTEELNLLPDAVVRLSGIWIKLRGYTVTRFAI